MNWINCCRCGKRLDFWKYYKTQICDECDEILERKTKEIAMMLDKKEAERIRKGDKGMKDKFLNMTDHDLAEYLRFYAHDRKGELADLCYAASIRIAVLSTGENRENKECGTSN